jgi:hypothetical protein
VDLLVDRPKSKIPQQLVKPDGRLVKIQVVAEYGEERALHARLRGVDLPRPHIDNDRFVAGFDSRKKGFKNRVAESPEIPPSSNGDAKSSNVQSGGWDFPETAPSPRKLMDPWVRAGNACQIMHDGKDATVVKKSFLGYDRQSPRRVRGDTQARGTETDDGVSSDILQKTFGSTNVLSKAVRGLCGDQLMPVAEANHFVAGRRDSTNDRRVLLSQPPERKKRGLR